MKPLTLTPLESFRGGLYEAAGRPAPKFDLLTLDDGSTRTRLLVLFGRVVLRWRRR